MPVYAKLCADIKYARNYFLFEILIKQRTWKTKNPCYAPVCRTRANVIYNCVSHLYIYLSLYLSRNEPSCVISIIYAKFQQFRILSHMCPRARFHTPIYITPKMLRKYYEFLWQIRIVNFSSGVSRYCASRDSVSIQRRGRGENTQSWNTRCKRKEDLLELFAILQLRPQTYSGYSFW